MLIELHRDIIKIYNYDTDVVLKIKEKFPFVNIITTPYSLLVQTELKDMYNVLYFITEEFYTEIERIE